MNSRTDQGDDGMIGLGVLFLMTIAFAVGEAQSDMRISEMTELTQPSPLNSQILIEVAPLERDTGISGAIRELSVTPIMIESRLDLGWSPDATLIEEYRQSGF